MKKFILDVALVCFLMVGAGVIGYDVGHAAVCPEHLNIDVVFEGEHAYPLSVERLNNFSEEYNKFIQKLQRGEVDLKQWERVRKAWKELE
jgi:hypothetical protein